MKLISLLLLLSPLLAQAQEWTDLAARAAKPEKTWPVAAKLPPPAEAAQYPTIRALRLDGRGLLNIPKEIGECANLEYLNLSENAISLDAADLAVLAKLPKLRVLILTGNRLTSLSPEFCKTSALRNLEHLAVDKNEISSVSPDLSDLTNLQLLVLSQNPLHSLPEEAGKLANLKAVVANSCNLAKWPEGDFKSLEFLDLPGNDLKVESLAGFSANLKTLVLTRNSITKLTLKNSGRKLVNLSLSDDLRPHLDKAGRDDISITWEK